ncbi:MAG: hypothetical protein AAGB32_02395 [Pseudomonadota bacterium]
MIDQYTFFAIAAVVLMFARYGTYFYTIYKGETKPHAFTWFLFGVITGIGTLAQFELNAGPSAWSMAFVSVTCFMIAVFALFIGEKNYTKSDWFALLVCLAAIPIWKATDNLMIALFIIMAIDTLTLWPTIRKSFHKPDTEPPISAFMAGARYFLMLFAIPDPTWQNLMYPFFLMMSDWGFALYIVIRRAQLGMPLHEYAQKKRPERR